MQTEIKIIRVVDNFVENGKGGYNRLEVTYESMYQGKTKTDTKKIMSFASPEAYNVLKDAAPDSKWMIYSEKEGEYRVWKGATPANGTTTTTTSTSPAAAKGTPASSRGDWETSEERARKQVYIIKQSSISSAIALLKTDKKQPEVKDILETAQIFTDFVLGTVAPAAAKSDIQGVLDLEDDVPL